MDTQWKKWQEVFFDMRNKEHMTCAHKNMPRKTFICVTQKSWGSEQLHLAKIAILKICVITFHLALKLGNDDVGEKIARKFDKVGIFYLVSLRRKNWQFEEGRTKHDNAEAHWHDCIPVRASVWSSNFSCWQYIVEFRVWIVFIARKI